MSKNINYEEIEDKLFEEHNKLRQDPRYTINQERSQYRHMRVKMG